MQAVSVTVVYCAGESTEVGGSHLVRLEPHSWSPLEQGHPLKIDICESLFNPSTIAGLLGQPGSIHGLAFHVLH